jgi:Dullard-like phosphatase family protein
MISTNNKFYSFGNRKHSNYSIGKISKKNKQKKLYFTPTAPSEKQNLINISNEEFLDFNEVIHENENLNLQKTTDITKNKIMKNCDEDDFYFSNMEETEDNNIITLNECDSSTSSKTNNDSHEKNSIFEKKNENSFNDIVKTLSEKKNNCNLSLQNRKEGKKKNSTKKQKPINKITIFIKKNMEEIEKLANTEEISNFEEYNESCIGLLDELVHMYANPPPKIKFPFAKDIPSKKRLAIFDLDETLAHSEFKNIEKAQHKITVKLPSQKEVQIGLNIRPHWKKALKEISKHYFIVVYTASDHSYADSILNFMDPDNEFFEYRLYRSNCIFTKVESDEKLKFYIKDLNIFEDIDLKDMVIIDNTILSYAYHLNNGIPILPYYNSEKDFELMFLAGYLNQIYEFDDLREANKKYIKLENLVKMIKDKEENKENKEENNNEQELLPMKRNSDTSVISSFLENSPKK